MREEKITAEELRQILEDPQLSDEIAELYIDSIYQLSWIAIDNLNNIIDDEE